MPYYLFISLYFCFILQCCLTVLGCSQDKMDIGYVYEDGRLEIYPSGQGIKLAVSSC